MAHEYYSADYTAAPQGQAMTYQQGAYQQAGYHVAYQQQPGYPQPGYDTAYYPQQVPGYAATHTGGWQQQAADPQQYQHQQYGAQDGPYGGSGTGAGVGALPRLPSEPPQPPLPEGAMAQLPSEPAPPLPEQPPLPSDPPSGAAPPLPPGPVGPQDPSQAYVGPAGGMSGGRLPYPPAQQTQEQQQQEGPALAGQYVQYPQQQGYLQQQAYQQPQQQFGAYMGQHQQQQGYYANGWGGSGHAYWHAASMPYAGAVMAATPHMQHAGMSMPYPQHQPAAAALSQGYQQQQQHAGGAPAAAPAAQPLLRPQRGQLAELLLPPGRAKRPKRLVLLLRGLPGSGKSRLARLVRDRETEQGGEPPRILSLDDYFMTEVEREVDDEEGGTGGGGKKGRKRKVQVMEYCYEPEMEGVYKRSLLKAYQRTLDEARFKFVILDAPNIRAGDFRDFWMAGQAAGYEVFVVEMPESDPQVCYQRNQHRRKLEDLYRLSAEYEPTPAVYACLDASSLLAKKQTPGGKVAISDVDMGEDEVEESDAEGDTPAGAPSSSRWASLEDDSSSPAAERSKRARLASNGSTSSLDRAAAGIKGGSGGSTQSMRDVDRSAGGDASYDGLADGIDEMLDRAATGIAAARGSGRGTGRAGGSGQARSGSSGSGRGILSSGGGGSGGRKRVRWPDQMEEDEGEDAGFRIGAESRQLETVYMVEGLGPPSGGTHPHPASFAAAVKAEHRVEANSFRSVMLGGAPKRLPGGGGGSSSKGA